MGLTIVKSEEKIQNYALCLKQLDNIYVFLQTFKYFIFVLFLEAEKLWLKCTDFITNSYTRNDFMI